MNKLAIPALLVATVMVAGAFAFMPIEQASTVHVPSLAALEGSSIVRTETLLDVTTGGTDYNGRTIYSLADGEVGVFTIEKLLLCDLEVDGPTKIGFSVEATLAQWTGTTGNLMIDDGNKFTKYFGSATANDCFELTQAGNEDGFRATLSGDENNDIIVHHFSSGGNEVRLEDTETDGALLIAYISGITSADDIDIGTNLTE